MATTSLSSFLDSSLSNPTSKRFGSGGNSVNLLAHPRMNLGVDIITHPSRREFEEIFEKSLAE